MTKEEYEKLLKSDYWKGYSYALIKERNFTCNDCGRQFPNERNKLQVHHLRYRDANPWSYNPDELVVLCEECHKKRHGIYVPPVRNAQRTSTTQEEVGRNLEMPRRVHDEPRMPYNEPRGPRGLFLGMRLVAILFLLAAGVLTYGVLKDNPPYELGKNQTAEVAVEKPSCPVEDELDSTWEEPFELVEEADDAQTWGMPSEKATTKSNGTSAPSYSRNNSSSQMLEQVLRSEVEVMAKEKGVSTSGSTSDILQRINHAEVEKLAKEKGVSTSGSTSDILQRVNQANLEELLNQKNSGFQTSSSNSYQNGSSKVSGRF